MKQDNILSKIFVLMLITLIRQVMNDSYLVVLSNLKTPFNLTLLIVKIAGFTMVLFGMFLFIYKNKKQVFDYFIPILTICLTIYYFFLDRYIPLIEAAEDSYVGHILSNNLYGYSLWSENIIFLIFSVWFFFKERKILKRKIHN